MAAIQEGGDTMTSEPKVPEIPVSYKASLPVSPLELTRLQAFLLDVTAGNLQMLNRQVAGIGALLVEIKK